MAVFFHKFHDHFNDFHSVLKVGLGGHLDRAQASVCGPRRPILAEIEPLAVCAGSRQPGWGLGGLDMT